MVIKKKAIFFDRDGVLNNNIFYKKYGQFEAPLSKKDLIINRIINKAHFHFLIYKMNLMMKMIKIILILNS